MSYFYEVSPVLRTLIQIFLFLSVTLEIALIINYSFLRREEGSKCYLLFELGIAWHFAVLNLCIGMVQITEPKNLLINPYPILRNLSIIAPISGMPLLLKERRNIDLLAIFALTFSLPFLESSLGTWYVNQFLIFNVFLFIRAFSELTRNYRYLRMNFSRFSMKQAFDTFPEGLAIGRHHGNIFISNQKMRKIMSDKGLIPDTRTSGIRVAFRRMMKQESLDYRDGKIDEPNISLVLEESEDKLRGFQNKGYIYRYGEEIFKIGRKEYVQILLSDITAESNLIFKIREKNRELGESNRQLLSMIQNIEAIELDKERQRMRNRIHDVMGQRLSILHFSLQNIDEKEEVPLDDLIRLLGDMVEDLNEPEHFNAESRYQHIENTAAIVGTELRKKGQIPADEEVAIICLQILREAVTNAIRHGKAATILAEFSQDDEYYYLNISNDGEIPETHLVEGEGIRGMRNKLVPLAGSLEIDTSDHFRIAIRIPRLKEEEIDTRH